MAKLDHPLEKLVQAITYRGVEFEVVSRPDVLWVGFVDCSEENYDAADVGAILKRYQEELSGVTKNDLVNPNYSGVLSVNFGISDKPCSWVFAQEAYSRKHDDQYDFFTQPGGLWLRMQNNTDSAALLGKKTAEPWEYFAEGILQNAANANGYMQNPDVNIQMEYHNHAECAAPLHANYAYIPVVRKQ